MCSLSVGGKAAIGEGADRVKNCSFYGNRKLQLTWLKQLNYTPGKKLGNTSCATMVIFGLIFSTI